MLITACITPCHAPVPPPTFAFAISASLPAIVSALSGVVLLMSAPRAAPIQTSASSASASFAHLHPDRSPPTTSHTPSPTPLSPDDLEPLPADLPTTVIVTSAETLSQEVERCAALLSSTAANWQVRVHSLQCVSELCRHTEWSRYDGLVALLWQHRAMMVSQLVDRRSAVVKQACATIAAVSTMLSSLLLTPSDPPPNSLDDKRRLWTGLTVHWLEHLMPNIPVTIKVISEATVQCFNTVLNNIAPLPPPLSSPFTLSAPPPPVPSASSSNGEADFALLYSLINGSSHKHALVREQCYRGLSTLLSAIPDPSLTTEQQLDAGESRTISASLQAYKAVTSELSEPSSPLPFSLSMTASGSLLFHTLEVCLYKGAVDSDARVRAASRAAVMDFSDRCSRERGERVGMAMPLVSQKLMETERQDRLITSSGSTTTAATAKDRKLSVRERMRQQEEERRKRQAEVLPKTITHSSPLSPRRAGKRGSGNGSSSPARQAEVQFTMGPFITGSPEEVEEASVGQGSIDEVKERESKAPKKDEPDVTSRPEPSSSTGPPPGSPTAASTALTPATVTAAMDDSSNRNAVLLTKLLDLDSPVLTERMQTYLVQDGVMETLLQFVLRLPGFDPNRITVPPLTALSAPLPRRTPPVTDDDMVASKRSYNVMTLLCAPRPSQTFLAILFSKLPVVLSYLLAGFLPQSGANLYHVSAILDHLFGLPSSLPLSHTLSSPSLLSMLYLAFDHLHEPPVPAVLLTILTSGDAKDKKKQLLAEVRKADVLPVLTARICQSMQPTSSSDDTEGELARCLASIDFIRQLVEKVSTEEYLTSFLATIADSGSLISQLTTVVTSSPSPLHPTAQVTACCSLLLSLVVATEEASILVADSNSNMSAASEMMFAKKRISNPLFALKGKVLALLSARLPDLATSLLKAEVGSVASSINFSSYSSPCFSQRRMVVLQLLTKVCQLSPESTLPLPRSLWSQLVDWLFVYEHNSFFLNSFVHLLLVLLQAAPDSPLQTEVLRYVLVDCKLVSRLIAHYHKSTTANGATTAGVSTSASSTALDSTILIICSHLRLTSSLHPPSSLLFSHLSSHSSYRTFLPHLLHESHLQAIHHPLPQSDESALLRALQQMGIKGATTGTSAAAAAADGPGDDGVDIGSRFAHSLGYREEAVAVVGKTGGSGRKARKKNRKNKKKARKALESEVAGEDDEEEEDDGSEGSGVESGVEEEKVSGEELHSAVISSKD